MASSSKPRTNLKAKMPATIKECASLQMQRRHTPLPPWPFPASYQSKNQVKDHQLFWVIPALGIQKRAYWNSYCVLLHTQETVKIKS